MFKGDLTSTPLTEVLRQLADGGATGCLHVVGPPVDDEDGDAQVFVRGGRVYAVSLPGTRPTLGARLVTSGALAPEALSEALEAQATELQGWRLSELLVHLGYVDQPVVEAFVQEQVREALSDLLDWTVGTWRFRVNQRTREDVAPPVEVDDLLAEVDRRHAAWRQVAAVIGGPDAVPLLSAAGSSDDEMVVDGDAWSLLCKVDGARTVAELARDCGLTMFEAGHVVHGLVRAGLLEVALPDALAEPEPEPEPEAEPEAEAEAEAEPEAEAFVPAAMAARLATALLGRPEPFVPAQAQRGDLLGQIDSVRRDETARSLDEQAHGDVESSISRVSQALSALLGQTPSTDDLFAAPSSRATSPVPPVDPIKAERTRKELLRRERDSGELAEAQAELEAARAADDERRAGELAADHVADVVDLTARRDEDARIAEQTRVAEEVLAEARAEQARLDEEAETARLAEEAEAARLAEEAEGARLAEEAERARLAEEARAAEETRLAEEAEAARLAEEAEGARLAEEARRAEQARLAEEAEAARLAQEAEAARLAEEAEGARLAEEARLAEQARLAEEAEAARLAGEAEALRVAQEAEAARLADEANAAEQARLAEETEQTRLAEEAQAARLAEQAQRLEDARAVAAAEVSRLAAEAEQAAAERLAREQAERDQSAELEAAEQFAAQTATLAGDDDQARDNAQLHAAVFAELSAAATVVVPEPVAEPAPAQSPVLLDDEPMPSYEQATDTAALLRELSSLGIEDDAPPPPQLRPVSSAVRPVSSGPPAKKRKGLFGRS